MVNFPMEMKMKMENRKKFLQVFLTHFHNFLFSWVENCFFFLFSSIKFLFYFIFCKKLFNLKWNFFSSIFYFLEIPNKNIKIFLIKWNSSMVFLVIFKSLKKNIMNRICHQNMYENWKVHFIFAKESFYMNISFRVEFNWKCCSV